MVRRRSNVASVRPSFERASTKSWPKSANMRGDVLRRPCALATPWAPPNLRRRPRGRDLTRRHGCAMGSGQPMGSGVPASSCVATTPWARPSGLRRAVLRWAPAMRRPWALATLCALPGDTMGGVIVSEVFARLQREMQQGGAPDSVLAFHLGPIPDRSRSESAAIRGSTRGPLRGDAAWLQGGRTRGDTCPPG